MAFAQRQKSGWIIMKHSLLSHTFLICIHFFRCTVSVLFFVSHFFSVVEGRVTRRRVSSLASFVFYVTTNEHLIKIEVQTKCNIVEQMTTKSFFCASFQSCNWTSTMVAFIHLLRCSFFFALFSIVLCELFVLYLFVWFRVNCARQVNLSAAILDSNTCVWFIKLTACRWHYLLLQKHFFFNSDGDTVIKMSLRLKSD